jgi:hypothetical protein
MYFSNHLSLETLWHTTIFKNNAANYTCNNFNFNQFFCAGQGAAYKKVN